MRAGKPVTRVVIAALVLAGLTLSLGGTSASKGVDPAATYEHLKLFTDVLAIIQNQYVDETEPREVIYGAVRGMLRALDPHSSFLDPESYREMQVETSGAFGGLGIEITVRDDQLTVVAPIEGTPAWRAGVQPGDKIIKIEGIATKDMSLTDAVKRMRGPKGTKVTISIMREGLKELMDVSVTREIIQVQSVKIQEIEPGLGYLRIRSSRSAPRAISRRGSRSWRRPAASRGWSSTSGTTPADFCLPRSRWRRSSLGTGSSSSTPRVASGTRTCASSRTPSTR